MVKFKVGDLFSAPSDTYLLHACNCQGMWGSGVAKQFAEKFPKSYKIYQNYCRAAKPRPGDILIIKPENGYRVVCLFTSFDYGPNVDTPEAIVEATKAALQYLPTDKPIHMPMINSGLFKVPWEQTAALLLQYDDLDITVWSRSE